MGNARHEAVIALLIPTTAKYKNAAEGMKWRTVTDSCLINTLLNGCMKAARPNMRFNIYLGIDDDDAYYRSNIADIVAQYESRIPNCRVYYYFMPPMSVVSIWNILYCIALAEPSNKYFFQCGDDIEFLKDTIFDECVDLMDTMNGFGLVWPIDTKALGIPTQSMVSRTHYDIFGYYFDPSIRNWGCDIWLKHIYVEYTLKTKEPVLVNTSIHQYIRYNALPLEETKRKRLVVEAIKRIKQYILENNITPSQYKQPFIKDHPENVSAKGHDSSCIFIPGMMDFGKNS